MPPQRETPRRRRDTWWKVFCLDPVVARLDRPPVNRTLARATLALGIAVAPCFALPGWWGPVAGGVGYLLSTLAERLLERRAGRRTPRLRGLARGRDLCCALAFTLGQYAAHRQAVILLLGLQVLLLEAFRQVEGVQMPPMAEVETEFAWWDWAYWYDRLDLFLARRGVDERVFGGTEFRTTVFVLVPFVAIVSPVAAAWTVALAGLLLVLSEVSVGFRIWSLVRYYRDFPPDTDSEQYFLDMTALIPAARSEESAAGAEEPTARSVEPIVRSVEPVAVPDDDGTAPVEAGAR